MREKIDFFVNDLANWLEVAGFIVTVVTAFKVFFLNKDIKRLNARHLFTVRVQEHLVELKRTSREISRYLTDFVQNTNEIRIEITKCLAYCNSLKKKVEKSELTTLKQIIVISNRIKSKKTKQSSSWKWVHRVMNRSPLTEQEAVEFYETLTLLITEIEQLDKDMKKSLK